MRRSAVAIFPSAVSARLSRTRGRGALGLAGGGGRWRRAEEAGVLPVEGLQDEHGVAIAEKSV